MYGSSNIKDTLGFILRKLIQLNHKYSYETTRESTVYKVNYRLVTNLNQTIKDVIKLKEN